MNARRNGSAPRASRNRQTGNRGAKGEADVPSGSAAVVSKRDGVGMCYPVRQRGAPFCGRETTRLQFEITSGKFGQRGCPEQRPAVRGRQGKCLMGRPCLGNGARLHATDRGSATGAIPHGSVLAEPMGDRADGAAGDG